MLPSSLFLLSLPTQVRPQLADQFCWGVSSGFSKDYCCTADERSRPECWSGFSIRYVDCCPNAECFDSGNRSFSRCCNGGAVDHCWDPPLTSKFCCELRTELTAAESLTKNVDVNGIFVPLKNRPDRKIVDPVAVCADIVDLWRSALEPAEFMVVGVSLDPELSEKLMLCIEKYSDRLSFVSLNSLEKENDHCSSPLPRRSSGVLLHSDLLYGKSDKILKVDTLQADVLNPSSWLEARNLGFIKFPTLLSLWKRTSLGPRELRKMLALGDNLACKLISEFLKWSPTSSEVCTYNLVGEHFRPAILCFKVCWTI
jgi:hypothetical protein